MRCGHSCTKISKTGICFSFSLHHTNRDQVGGSGNVDLHSGREHRPVPRLHEAGVRSICPQAGGMYDSAFDHGCCRAGVRWEGYASSAKVDYVPGVRGEMHPTPPGQQFLRTMGLHASTRGRSGLICLKNRPLLPCSLIFVWL